MPELRKRAVWQGHRGGLSSKIGLENIVIADRVGLSSKTGLIVRSADSAVVNCLFVELESKTFSVL